MRFVSEHGAIAIDQLARLLGKKQDETEQLVERLELAGCLFQRRFLINESAWIWLRVRGARFADDGLHHKEKPPAISGLPHRRAIVNVRLHLERRAPAGRWVSERHIRCQRAGFDRIPDAVFEVNGERHAIEVELTCKAKKTLREIIAENCARYDAVVYFCGSKTRSLLDRIEREGDQAKLFVRDLPGEAPAPVSRPAEWIPTRWLEPDERQILRIVAEQGAIPIDQLVRFVHRDPVELGPTLAGLSDANCLRYERLTVDEPKWIWLKKRGARISGTSLSVLHQRPGELAKRRALNEIRLQVAERAPAARWVSSRVLLRELGQHARVPGAVVYLGDQRHAINVKLNKRDRQRLEPAIARQCADYDAVAYFCGNPWARTYIEGLKRQHHWPNLIVRDLPTAGAMEDADVFATGH